MTTIRNASFWFFTLVFAVACPTVALYALGYLKTGMITLSVTPPEAEVHIAGRVLRGPWPRTVPKIAPGTYETRVNAGGYSARTRIVSIERGQNTTLDHLYLLPAPLVFEPEVDPETFTNLTPIEGQPYLLLEKKSKKGSRHYIYDTDKQKIDKLFPPGSPFENGEISRIDTVEKSPFVLVWFSKNVVNNGVLVDLRETPPGIRTDNLLISKGPLASFWSPSYPEHYFVAENRKIFRVFRKDNQEKDQFGLASWRGFGIGGGETYCLDDNWQMRKLQPNGSLKKSNGATPEAVEKAHKLFKNQEFCRIIQVGENHFLFLAGNGELFQNQLPNRLVETGVKGVRIGPGRKRILVWQDERAGIIVKPEDVLKDEKSQLKVGSELKWFYSNGQKIRNVYLFLSGSHALIQDEYRVMLVELFPGGETRVTTVIDVLPDSNISWVEKTGKLYFLDAVDGKFRSTKLFEPVAKPEIILPSLLFP